MNVGASHSNTKPLNTGWRRVSNLDTLRRHSTHVNESRKEMTDTKKLSMAAQLVREWAKANPSLAKKATRAEAAINTAIYAAMDSDASKPV